MGYRAIGNHEDIPAEYARPVTTDAEMLLGVDARYGPLAAAQRLPLAAMGVYAMVAAWQDSEAPTAADLAAYSNTPVHEMDQLVALLLDAGYIEPGTGA